MASRFFCPPHCRTRPTTGHFQSVAPTACPTRARSTDVEGNKRSTQGKCRSTAKEARHNHAETHRRILFCCRWGTFTGNVRVPLSTHATFWRCRAHSDGSPGVPSFAVPYGNILHAVSIPNKSVPPAELAGSSPSFSRIHMNCVYINHGK